MWTPTIRTISTGSTRSGCSACIDGNDPGAAERVREMTSGDADAVLEMASSVPALENAIRMTGRGGTTVTSGLPSHDAALALNIVRLVAEERTLKGSYIGTGVPARDVPRYIALYKSGRLPVDRLLSGELKLEEINTGLDRLRDGSVVRQIIKF